MTHLIPRAALAAALTLGLGACASDPDQLPPTNPFKGGQSERELRLEADGLYRLARRSLEAADFQGAIQRYDQILVRYPFTDYATQAQLEMIYARYRAFDPDGAISTANRFLKEHPRHAAIDYVYYLKGLINFQRGESALDWLVESTGQDVGYARRAFDDFALMVQRYPTSRYAGDARLRMVHLRNKIAAHELSVVKFYVRRGAHIAAAKRAERIIAEYPGAPILGQTLALLENSYREIGLAQQADEIRRVRDANAQTVAAPVEPAAPAQAWPWTPATDPIPLPPPQQSPQTSP